MGELMVMEKSFLDKIKKPLTGLLYASPNGLSTSKLMDCF